MFEYTAAAARFRMLDGSSVAEVKKRPSGKVLAGIAMVYNRPHPAEWGGKSCQDTFAPGCFARFMAGNRGTDFCRMHIHTKRFGGTGDGALALVDTPEALLFKLRLDEDDPESVKLFRNVAAGTLSGA